MRKLALLAVLAGTVLAAPVPAHAETYHLNQDEGRCGLTSSSSRMVPEVQNGELHGGPLTAGVNAPGSVGAVIWMKCTVQVGAENSMHLGWDSASASNTQSLQTTTLSPTTISYAWRDGLPVYLCTEVWVDGWTYYWDAWSKTWAFFPNHAGCDEAVPLVSHGWSQCEDGIDNDLDGRADYSGGDPDCHAPADPVEAPLPTARRGAATATLRATAGLFGVQSALLRTLLTSSPGRDR